MRSPLPAACAVAGLATAGYLAWKHLRPESIPTKAFMVKRYYPEAIRERPFQTLRFLLVERETDNFTYDLANTSDLAPFLASALRLPPAAIGAYLGELQDDQHLRNALQERLRHRRDRNHTPRYGRRMGWYALIRATQPRLVIETGIHDGLGSAVLLQALSRNGDEGHPGRLMSFDIDPAAGWLVPDHLMPLWTRVIGDTKRTLPRDLQHQKLDLFIHDSDHSPDYERWELEMAHRHASSSAILISDNAHASTVLSELSQHWQVPYHFFREQPRGHFYRGGGIGLAVLSQERVHGAIDAGIGR